MAMRSEAVSWSDLVDIYSGDYKFLFKLYGRKPDWMDRTIMTKMLIDDPIDKKAISKSIQDSGIPQGPKFGKILSEAIEEAYKAKVSEFLKFQL